jgi:hypothetical protein
MWDNLGQRLCSLSVIPVRFFVEASVHATITGDFTDRALFRKMLCLNICWFRFTARLGMLEPEVQAETAVPAHDQRFVQNSDIQGSGNSCAIG